MPRAVIAALLLGTAGVVWAGPASAQDRGTRSPAARGLDAAGKRAIEAKLGRTEAERDAYAAKFGISRRLLRSVAQEVGLANPNYTDQQLMTAVEAMADRAVKLQADNARMREEIARLSDPALRDPALVLLAEAESALEEGRLADAEAVYGRLRELRWDESRAAEEAWSAAVEGQARTAELQQDFVRAQDLRLAASDDSLARAEASHRRAFTMADAAAQGRYQEGDLFGRTEALDAAIDLWVQRVLPMAPKDREPERWAMVHNNLGIGYAARAALRAGENGALDLSRAIAAFEGALTVYEKHTHPADWSMVHSNMGDAWRTIGTDTAGEEGLIQLRRALTAFGTALEVRSPEKTPAEWAATQNNLGLALSVLGERTSGPASENYLQQSANALRQALSVFAGSGDWREIGALHSNLGATLVRLGERSVGASQGQLYREAINHFEQSLVYRTRQRTDFYWAESMANLGGALVHLGLASPDEGGEPLLRRAIDVLEQSLEVRDAERMPLQAATSNFNLGQAWWALSRRSGSETAVLHMRQALARLDQAIPDLDPDYSTYLWARAQNMRAVVLMGLGFQAPPSEARGYFLQSIAIQEQLLKGSSPDDRTLDWAGSKANLGLARLSLAYAESGAERIAQLRLARADIVIAVDVFAAAGADAQHAHFTRALDLVDRALADELAGQAG